jgi:AcrR family transcriptional regulator
VAKTSFEDVAREAGCSRATLYRSFPGGRDALFAAVVDHEVSRLFGTVAVAMGSAASLEDAIVGAITEAARLVEQHDALRYLLQNEPGLVLPHLAFHQLDALLARASAFAAPLLARFLHHDEAARAAEWITRIFLSYSVSPAPGVQLTDPASVRRLVRAFVLPGLAIHNDLLVPTA